MTRFARAKGSKASNERQPEAATPWSEIKRQLLEKKQEDDNKEKREEIHAKRTQVYQEFVAEHRKKKENKGVKWAEFPGVKRSENKSKKVQKKKKEKLLLGVSSFEGNGETTKPQKKSKKRLKKQPSNEVNIDNEEDFNIEEGASDDESSEEFNNLRAKLDKILENEELEGTHQKVDKISNEDDVIDEVSEESSSKTKQVKVKKVKLKKKKLVIQSPDNVDEALEESTSKTKQDDVKVEKVKLKKKKLEIQFPNTQKRNVSRGNQEIIGKGKNDTNTDKCSVLTKKGKKKIAKANEPSQKGTVKNKKTAGEQKTKKILNMDELDDKTKAKIERKQRKRQRQSERRKLKKAKLAAEREAQDKTAENGKNAHIQQDPKNKRPNESFDDAPNRKKKKFSEGQQDTYVKHSSNSEQHNNNVDNRKSKPSAAEKKQPKKKEGDKNRRKPLTDTRLMINGKVVDLEYVEGFPIQKEDAERLKKLRKQMISKGLPRSEIKNALKLERRRAEKALSRLKKEVCYNCRLSGHNLSECPKLTNADPTSTIPMGICFKCGSTEHKSYECKVVKGDSFKFATCFICKEQGHLSKQCPDNPRGLYPKGGACNVCGDVTHLKKDCPQYQNEQREQDSTTKLGVMGESNPDDLEDGGGHKMLNGQKPMNKIIKF